MSTLYSPDLESNLLSALVRNPALLADIPQITEKDFGETNRPVWQMLKVCAAEGKELNKWVLIERMKASGMKLGGVLEPETYINALELRGVNDKAAIGVARELKRWTIRRELNAMGKRIEGLTAKDDPETTAVELVEQVTSTFNERVNLLGNNGEDEATDLYGTIPAFLDHGDSAFDTRSVPTPYPLYNDMYGFLDPGNIYVLAARPKGGKSTWVMSMLQQIAIADGAKNEFIGLILDTELTVDEVQCRAIASLTGIKEFYIRHKIYRKFPDMVSKVHKAREFIKPLFAKVHHVFVGGMSLEAQLSFTRRWVAKHVRGTKRCVVVLDYFKLNADSEFNSNQPRDIILGKKVNAYKNLAKELHIPVWALVQAGRENEDSKAGGRISNGNAIAGSDMISQFASNIYLFQRLSIEERLELNQISPDSATHNLIEIYTRQQGPDELEQRRLVKYPDPRTGKERYKENSLFYCLANFGVTEIGSLRDIVERNKIAGIDVQGVTQEQQERML